MSLTAEAYPSEDTAEAGVRTILVVDDHLSFAEMLSAALDTIDGLTCVATAGTAAEGIALAARLRPSIVIMDIQMPGQDGLEATRQIREAAPDTLVAVVTAYRDEQWISRAAQAGACGFIPKNGSLPEMVEVLRRVRHGQLLVAPSAFTGGPVVTPDPITELLPALTRRELDVLTGVGQGMPDREIAGALGITLHTCRWYLKSVHAKLGVGSHLEAVIKAERLGLINSVA
jgi:DNA-binding NarL/FixJ family response regulator